MENRLIIQIHLFVIFIISKAHKLKLLWHRKQISDCSTICRKYLVHKNSKETLTKVKFCIMNFVSFDLDIKVCESGKNFTQNGKKINP